MDAHPVIADPVRYNRFVQEYRVLQGVPGDIRKEIRQWMREDGRLDRIIQEDDGAGVEEATIQLSQDFPGIGLQRSFVSKIGAFARPSRILA